MNAKWLNNPAAVSTLLAAISALVFVVDMLTPQGAVEWIAYVLPVMLAGRVSRPRAIVIQALLCSALIILGFHYSAPGSIEPKLALINRFAGIAVLWIITGLLVLHRRSQDALTKAEGDVKTKSLETVELTAELEARKLIERQRTDFFSMVTHDLKSPLTVIMGYTDLMLETKSTQLDPDCLQAARSIKKSSEKLLGMVEEFLEVSRIETGAAVLEKSPEDAASMLREIAGSFKPVAAKKGIELELSAAEGLPVVMMDRKYVERAVTNLVSNAVSYTPAGGRVALGAAIKDGHLEISVTDTGPGIPVHEQQRLYEKFYRAKGSAGSRGSGLGLAIVKGVAEAHGGRVELESGIGTGSTFTMFIPVPE